METLENKGQTRPRRVSQKQSKSARTRPKLLVVDGYGIEIRVNRGQLIVVDGSGRNRRQERVAKAGHGLDRLVVIGRAGIVTLEAMRWLDRTGISLLHLDGDARPLTVSAALGSDDARLRRSQALAASTETGQKIARALLDSKLAGQARVARNQLDAPTTASAIDVLRAGLDKAETIAGLVELEAGAAVEYFAAWRDRVAITWARNDADHVPEHWHGFHARRSLLSYGSAVRASDPVNAVLNYLYGLAEAECTLACRALGLDPGLGIIHADVANRDSLALDLIETVRPEVDAYVVDLFDGHIFARKDFIESEDGHVRVAAPLARQLAQTLPSWRTAVAPHAESLAHALADASPYRVGKPTPLTSAIRRQKAVDTSANRRKHGRAETPAAPQRKSSLAVSASCRDCGGKLSPNATTYCADCWPQHRSAAGRRGSAVAAQRVASPEGRAARSQAVSKGRLSALAAEAEALGFHPDAWDQLQPQVALLTLRQIMEASGLSQSYASKIKRGVHQPHPKHWSALAAASARAGG